MPRARLTAAALLLISLAGLWHVLLLRLWLDQPIAVAGLLAVVFVLAAATFRPTGSSLAFLAFFIVLTFLFHWGYERAASDGREYYVQVRSLVMDWDLDFANDNAAFGVRGTASRYAFGATVLWIPFFVAAHLWLGVLNLLGSDHVRDGFSNPYQQAIGLGTLVYGCIGLVLIARVLGDFFSSRLAVATTLVLCCGSFLIWYLTVENSMVHGTSMFATTLFLWCWHRTRATRTSPQWALLGLTAGLMTMVRWQNVLFIAVPVGVDLVGGWWNGQRATRNRYLANDTLAFGIAALVAFAPQLIFWRIVRGAWLSLPAGEHGFDLSRLYIGDVLFSSNHGLFTWTPLLYIALLGLPVFYRRDRLLCVALAAGFLGQLVINAGVDVWWGGSGFGARRFSNSALVFAVGLASLLDLARRRPLLAPAAILVALLTVNGILMLDFRRGDLSPSEGLTFDRMSGSVYERIGNPFALPMSAIVAWRYEVGLPLYDRILGRTYNNVDVDLGELDDDRFLGGGWSGREQAPGFSFRWAVGPESVVVVPLKEPDDYQLNIHCEPLPLAGYPPQVVDVVVNGRSIASVTMDRGSFHYPIRIPASALKPNLNQIRFRYSRAVSPAAAGAGADERPLTIQCDALRFVRLLAQ